MVGDEAAAAVVDARRLGAGRPAAGRSGRRAARGTPPGSRPRPASSSSAVLMLIVNLLSHAGLVALVPDALQVRRQRPGPAASRAAGSGRTGSAARRGQGRAPPALTRSRRSSVGSASSAGVRPAAESKSGRAASAARWLSTWRARSSAYEASAAAASSVARHGRSWSSWRKSVAAATRIVTASAPRTRDVVAERHGRPALASDACARVENAVPRAPTTPPHHVVASLDPLECVVAAVVVRSELDRSRPDCLEPEHDDVVRGAREDLAPEADPAELVLHRRDPVVEVERAPVARDELLVVATEQQRHVAEHLVARLTVRHPEHRELGERVRLARPSPRAGADAPSAARSAHPRCCDRPASASRRSPR